MKKKLISIFIILFPIIAKASLSVNDINIRPALKANYPTTIYLAIDNDTNQLDYLLSVEIMDQQNSTATINKTVIEKNVARIIKIDRLAIPPNSKIDLAPFGIYIVANNFYKAETIKIRFVFKNAGEIIKIVPLLPSQ